MSIIPCTAELYQLVGAFDAYGHCHYVKIYKEKDGNLSQNYPGHSYIRMENSHKKFRWWVKEKRFDGPELMHWTPDIEELDKIERILNACGRFNPDIPRYSLHGSYPTWKQVYPGS